MSSSFLTGSFRSDGRRSLSGFHRFIFIFTFFHFPAKKSVHMGEVGSDPRAGYFFQRSSVPPRSPLHYQLENGGAINTYFKYVLYMYVGLVVTGRQIYEKPRWEIRIQCI